MTLVEESLPRSYHGKIHDGYAAEGGLEYGNLTPSESRSSKPLAVGSPRTHGHMATKRRFDAQTGKSRAALPGVGKLMNV